MIKILFNVFKRDQKSIKYIKMSKAKKILLSLVVCALILFALSSMLMPIVLNADKIKETLFLDAGIISLIIGLYVSFIVALISSIGFLFSSCYLDKNLNNYLFLPIKRREFVIAKLMMIYYNVIAITALIFLPFALLYLYISKITIFGILTIIVYFFTMPILTIALSTLLLGTLLYFVNKVRNKKLAKTIIYTISIGFMLAIYLYFIFMISMSPEDDPITLYLNAMSIIDKISLFFTYPNWAYSLLLSEDLIALVKMIGLSIVGIVSFLYFEKIYFKGAIGFNESSGLRKKRNNKKNDVKNHSITVWFFLKEAKEILKTGSYFFNTIFGNILIVVVYLAMISYAYFFQGLAQDSEFMNELISMVNIEMIILITIVIGTFFTIFNNGAATVFSREAKSLDIISSLPISKRQAFFGKVLFHELVEFLTLSIFMIPPMIVLEIPILYIIVSVLIMILVVLSTNFIPIIIDLNFPNLDWESETAVVKSSRSIWISMIAHFILNAIVLGSGAFLLLVLKLDYKLVVYVAIVFYLVLFALLIAVYSKSVDRAFRKVRN